MLLLDTHAILWWAFNPELLSLNARKALDDAQKRSKAFYSSVSLWEIGIKVKNKKLEIPMRTEQFKERLADTGFIESIPVTDEIWLESIRLAWKHKDPADRVIVATCKMNSLKLITKDKAICSYRKIPTIW